MAKHSPAPQPPAPAIVNVDLDGDPLLAFASEEIAAALDQSVARADVAADQSAPREPVVRLPKIPVSGRPQVKGMALVAGAAIVLVVGLSILGALYSRGLVGASAAEFGTFTIETEPSGADVIVDGQSRGSSPLKMSLAPGAHAVVVRRGGEERRVPLTLAAGTEVVHHVEFGAVKAAPIVGGISVVTDPPGARVVIDGRGHGASPVTLGDLAAGQYKVSVSTENGAAERTVAVRAGETVSVVFSLPKVSGPAAGWAAVSSPFDVQVLEDNNVVGTGRNSKVMMPAGKHTFSIVNQALGYQVTRTADITAGKTVNIQIDAPKVAVNVNARPWADVFIDGKSIGQTPIGNLSLAIGTYEVIFRHPDLGERRQTVTVTAKGANRIGVDLTK